MLRRLSVSSGGQLLGLEEIVHFAPADHVRRAASVLLKGRSRVQQLATLLGTHRLTLDVHLQHDLFEPGSHEAVCAAAAERHERFLEQLAADYAHAQSLAEELEHLPPPAWLDPESVKLTMSAKRKEEVQQLYASLTPEGIHARAMQSLSDVSDDFDLEELLRPSPASLQEQFTSARSTTRRQKQSLQGLNSSANDVARTSLLLEGIQRAQQGAAKDLDVEPSDM